MTDHDTSQPDSQESSRQRLPLWWWIAAAVVLLVRMYIVADDEIVPRWYDSVYYAQTAAHYFDVDHDFSIFPTHRPGLGIVAWTVAELGIPYKLFLDGLLIAASLMAAIVFFRLTNASLASFLLFMAILWHPWFILQSWMFMTEPLVSILLLLILICSVPLICQPIDEWPLSMTLIAAIASSVLVLSRNEILILAGFYLVILVIVLCRQRRELKPRLFVSKGGWRIVFLFVPLIAAWASETALKKYHESRFGVPAMCATEADGFQKLLSALYSIDPEKKQRYVPVPYESLQKACEHSSVMAGQKEWLLDQDRGAYHTAARVLKLGGGEVGTWLNWHLVDTFQGVSLNSNRQMRVAAREIRNAIARGDLPGRKARFPIDPLTEEWMPEIPLRFWWSIKHSTRQLFPSTEEDCKKYHLQNSVERSFYDIGLLRRGGTGFNRAFYVHAKCHRRDTKITSVQILTRDHQLVADVPVFMDFEGYPAFNFAFNDSDSVRARQPLALRAMRSAEADQPSLIHEMRGNARNRYCEFVFDSEDGTAHRESWALSFNRHVPKNELRKNVRDYLYAKQWLGMLIAVIVAAVSGLFLVTDRRTLWNVAWVTLAALALWWGRGMFYTLIDAWLHWGLNRYIHPNVFLAIVTLTCAGFLFGALIRASGERFLRRPESPTST